MCVSCMCVTFITYTNGACVCFRHVSGETKDKGTPSPFRGRATVRLPPSKFFIFFLPYPITSSITPFSFPLRGFFFLCVYFPTRVSFRVSGGQKYGENRNCFSCPTCAYVVIVRSIFIFCYFLCCVFLLICLFFCPLWGFLRFCV